VAVGAGARRASRSRGLLEDPEVGSPSPGPRTLAARPPRWESPAESDDRQKEPDAEPESDSDRPSAPELVLPIGTRVVTRVEVKTDAARAHRPVGAVGEIVATPADAFHSYRVRFPDGAEASLRRRDFSIWSRYREETISGPTAAVPPEVL